MASTGQPAALITMKLYLALSAIVTVTFAKPSGFLAAPLAYATVPIAAPVATQYHAQDELGQYTYGYASGLSAKTETKTVDGVTRGSYSYVDAEGKLQSVEYVSDALNGFRAAASNLPVAPVAPALVAPVPVVDTPEVVEARAKHLAALQEVATRASTEETPVTSEVPSTEPPAPSPAPEVNATAVAPLASAVVAAAPYTFAVPAVSAFAAPAVATYRFGPAVLPAVATYSAPWTVVAPAPAATVEAKAAAPEQPKQK